jgi:hypothetical protein
VQNLALEVGEIDSIGVDERYLANTRCRQIHGGRRTQSTCSHNDDVRIEKASLRLDANFVHKDVAGVSEELIVVHGRLTSQAASAYLFPLSLAQQRKGERPGRGQCWQTTPWEP